MSRRAATLSAAWRRCIASLQLPGALFLCAWAHAAEPEPYQATPGNWVFADDYPREALRANMQGVVEIRAVIGTDGRLHDCVVVASRGFELLDRTTCDLVTRRALHNPAVDDEGKPVESLYQNRVRWGLSAR